MLRYVLSGLAGATAFTVHEPPPDGQQASRIARAESVVFVRDGFCWRAALFSPFYLLIRREWRGLLLYILAATVIALVLSAVGARSDWMVLGFILLNIVTGYEANQIKRWSLDRAGWQEIGSVSGSGQDEAERRFFEAWLPTLAEQETAIATAMSPWSTTHAPNADTASRLEASVKGLAARLRQRFATKP